MRLAFALSMLTLLAGSTPVLPDDDRVELNKLQGTWQITRVEENGGVWPKEKVENIRLIITGSHFRLDDGKATLEGGVKVDATARPKSFDGVVEFSRLWSAPVLGIYKQDGNTLEVCFTRGKNRPDDFETGPGLPKTFFIAKRKPEDKAPH